MRNRSMWPLLFVVALGAACPRRPAPAFIHLAEARRLTAEIRGELSRASDASDRAVLADTDQQSAAFARAAQQATGRVTALLPELAGHLAALEPADAELLAQFQERFQAYETLDRRILSLAVENTNLKAQHLAFGPVRQAADAFCAALDRAAETAPAAGRAHARDLAARAELAVREIQVLQAPHIAEPDDAQMDRLEREMAGRAAAARAAPDGLAPLVGAAGRPDLDRARAALDQFDTLSRQLIGLSRRNSNVRSLELALREKPALTAACDERLAALQAALAREGFSGTR